MTSLTVLRTERDGVEFFTLAATEESGMSQTGLARACGISQQAMSELEKALVTQISPKTLKTSTSKGFNPTTKTSSKTLKPLSAKGFNPTTKEPSEWLQLFVGKDLSIRLNFPCPALSTR